MAACGGGGDDPPGNDDVDAAIAPGATVMATACGAEVMTIESTNGFRFAPNNVAITVGQVIRFENGQTHSIVPAGANADPGFRVGFGATTCLMFTAPGAFAYRCNPHTSMTGTITVN
jgi:plastocyanin